MQLNGRGREHAPNIFRRASAPSPTTPPIWMRPWIICKLVDYSPFCSFYNSTLYISGIKECSLLFNRTSAFYIQFVQEASHQPSVQIFPVLPHPGSIIAHLLIISSAVNEAIQCIKQQHYFISLFISLFHVFWCSVSLLRSFPG